MMHFLRHTLFLAFLPLVTSTCPPRCRCSSSIIDCMDAELTNDNLPTTFRPSTTQLFLNKNFLTFIPNGLFDNLKSLQMVYLWENPWECDCSILYLRSWLQWQQNRTLYRDVVCTGPSHLRGRIIRYLSEDEIVSTCQSWYCSLAFVSQVCLLTLLLVQAVLLIFIIIYLRRFHRIAKEAKGANSELYENADTWASTS